MTEFFIKVMFYIQTPSSSECPVAYIFKKVRYGHCNGTVYEKKVEMRR